MVKFIYTLLFVGLVYVSQAQLTYNPEPYSLVVANCQDPANYDKQKLLIMKPIDFFLLFFPQLFITFIFTKVRIQTFFVNAVLLHIAYNFVILMLSFLFDT